MSRSFEPSPMSSVDFKSSSKIGQKLPTDRPIGIWNFFGVVALLSVIFLILIMLIMYLMYRFFGDESWVLYTFFTNLDSFYLLKY